RNSPGKNTRIMTPACREFGLLARGGYSSLLVGDRGRRLKANPKINLLAVADSALHTPGVVCRCPDFPSAHFEWIVMLRAAHARVSKPGANIQSLGRWHAQHRFREVSFKLVKNGLTQSRRDAMSNAFNHTTDRVAFTANFLDKRCHLLRGSGITTAKSIFLDILHCYNGTIDFRGDLMNLRDVSDDLGLRTQDGQYLFCDCACGDPANGLTRRRPASPLPIANSIFGLVSEISM